MKKKIFAALLLSVSVLMLASCSKKQGAKLFENPSPETSGLCFYYFDGEKTYTKWLFDETAEGEVVDELNSLSKKKAEDTALDNWPDSCYGLSIADTEGSEIWVSYADGMWLTDTGKVYIAEYDLAAVYENLNAEEMMISNGGMGIPNSAVLCKHNIKYYGKADEETNPDISLTVTGVEGRVVSLKLENVSSSPITYGEYFSLEKEIGGSWYQVPVAIKNYAFIDLATEMPAGGSCDLTIDLAPYGDIEAGHYRVRKEHASAEFDLTALTE